MNKGILKQSLPMTNPLSTTLEDGRINFVTKLCLAIIFMAALSVGFLPQLLIGVIVLCACIPLITTKDIYLVHPIMLFYYAQFGAIFGLSVYRLFSFIFFMFSLFYERTLRFKKIHLAPFILFTLYCIIVISPDNLQKGFFAIFDMLCIMILVTHYLSDKIKLKKFFKIYSLISLVAFFTGTQLQNSLDASVNIDGEWVDVVRNLATFEDPNYMGFFYTTAVFALITLKLFNPKIRILFIIALYAMILSTLSVTAIVVNVLMWGLYLSITKKINLKTFVIIFVIIAILLGMFSYGKKNPDTPIFGMLAIRLSEKFTNEASSDISGLTSGRSDLAGIHFDYFLNLPIWKMFVGMNAASALKTDLDGFKYAGHNEYVDWLLNVGIIGAAIMLFFLLKRTYTAYRKYRENENTSDLCVLFCKFIWIAYAFTLTVYGDFRFLFTLLL